MRTPRQLFIQTLFACLLTAGTLHAAGAGDPVPDFSLTGLDGQTYSLSDYRGKILVLYFLGYN